MLEYLRKSKEINKFLLPRGAELQDKLSLIVKKGSNRKVFVRRGKRTILKLPLTVGIGSATAAILMNAPLTAISALIALSNNISITIQKDPGDEDIT